MQLPFLIGISMDVAYVLEMLKLAKLVVGLYRIKNGNKRHRSLDTLLGHLQNRRS